MSATLETRLTETVALLGTAHAPVLDVRLFGTPTIRYAGRAVRLNLSRKTLRLLAYLLLDGAFHERERVAFALWPDAGEAAARANLRRQLHLLQRALPVTHTPWLLVGASSIAWNSAAPCRLDVAEFEFACASGDTLDMAVDLYAGELLAGWDDEWVVPLRARLGTLAVGALTELVARLRAAGDAPRAIVFAQRLRELDPWRENAVRTLIALRYETGDRAGALTEYDRFVRALDDELGVDPMPETQALYEALVENAPVTLAEVAPAAVAAPNCRDVMPFVGRDAECDQLGEAWNRVHDGAGETIVVGGEPGAGKSRLIDEFAARVEALGGRTMLGRTTAVEAIALQPFADALRRALPLVRALPVAPAWLGVLCAVVPQLRVARPELPEPPPLSPPQERARLFEAVTVVLAALADVRPLLVIVEDLHCAGESTLALFEYVARRVTRSRVLLVGTYCDDGMRTRALRDVRRRLERESLLSTLPLGGLAPEGVAALMARLVDGTPERCAAIGADLHRRCDGNASVLHETLRACAASGVFDAGRRSWDDDTARRELSVPENLAESLRVRVERLPPDVRIVVEIAAVAGRVFSAELVRDVSGFDERRALDALDRLIDERIVRESGGGRGDYTFCHPQLRTAVYQALPEPLRRRRHRRVGGVLEQLHPDRTGELAVELAGHFDRGDEPKRAAAHYARAAADAAAVFANREAIEWARRALELSDDVGLRLELISLAETLYGRLGDRGAQRAAITRLVSLATELRDHAALLHALTLRVELERACGDADAERDARRALAAEAVSPPGVPKTSDRPALQSDARTTASALA